VARRGQLRCRAVGGALGHVVLSTC
jgi:hypothetical protein